MSKLACKFIKPNAIHKLDELEEEFLVYQAMSGNEITQHVWKLAEVNEDVWRESVIPNGHYIEKSSHQSTNSCKCCFPSVDHSTQQCCWRTSLFIDQQK